MNNIVVYYSNKGSNKYLAERTAEALECELLPLKPRAASFFLLLLASATKLSLGNRALKTDFSKYDSVILCGPIWMGQIAAPLYDFIKKHKSEIKRLSFISCCGSTDEIKDHKFGYATVFSKIKDQLGGKCHLCRAFPVNLLLPEDKQKDDQAMMNTRLSDSNFSGEIKRRFDLFIEQV